MSVDEIEATYGHMSREAVPEIPRFAATVPDAPMG